MLLFVKQRCVRFSIYTVNPANGVKSLGWLLRCSEHGHLEEAVCLGPGRFEDPSSRQKKIVKGKTSLDVYGLYLGAVQREGEKGDD